MAYFYTPAFVAYCKGAPVEEIATQFSIPLDSLKAKMRAEGWKTLAGVLFGNDGPLPAHTADALARIEANRTKNYELAVKLRDNLRVVLDALCAGTLRIKKLFNYKGTATEYDAPLTISDLVNLATYAHTIHEMTYRALGDHGANGGKADTTAAAAPPAPAMTIILPAAIALPRDQRQGPDETRLLEA